MKKLLVADNLKTFINCKTNILTREGFEIFTATSGEEALEVHKREKVDVIITDLDMPGMSGDKLCSLIRKDEELKHVSIIVVCSSSLSDMERVVRCKANSYITKPIKPEQFAEKVSQLLDIPERKSCRVLLRVSVDGKDFDRSCYCSSRDISETGILLQTDRTFVIGDVVSCSFFLPNSQRVVTDAEIVRVARNGDNTSLYGARYVNLSPQYKTAIEKFIRGRLAKG